MSRRRLSTQPAAPPRGYLMVAPWEVFRPGGVSTAVAGLGAALHRSGRWSVLYLELADANSDSVASGGQRVFRRRVRTLPGTRTTTRGWLAFLLTLVPTTVRLLALLREHHVDVVNIHFPTQEAWLFAALRKLRIYQGRLVLSVHGMDIRETLRSPERARAMRWIYEAADAVVACSSSLARDVPHLAPPLGDVTYAVHNGIETPKRSQTPPPRRGAAAGPDGAHTMLCVATFEPKKGLDVLLEAFALCRAKHPALRLRVIGQRRTGDSTYDEVVTRIGGLGLGGSVDLATDIANHRVLAAMDASDVLVLPSRWEPFGLVLLEAGVVGTPIVATDVDGIPEVVPSAEYGLLVRPEDPTALAAAILDVLDNPAAARRRAENMRRRVQEHFTWDHAAAKYSAILDVLQGAGNTSRVRPDAR